MPMRKPTNRREEGFTLIELMVVVMIIAILIAIAVPTFLGARGRAQDRTAQSNLRNELSAAKTVFTDTQAYPAQAAMVTALNAAEPSLTAQVAIPTTPKTISVDTSATFLILVGRSDSGRCYGITDSPTAGTKYGTVATCAAASATTPNPTIAADSF